MTRLLPLAAVLSLTASVLPAAEQGPWWSDATFYQIYTRSFQDSRTGPLANDGVGDIQGMIDRLDYLNDGDPATTSDLGISGIWLLPMAESDHPGGYSVMDYETIQHDYGTNADFRRFIEEAHRRGIRVIVDLVLNHCSHKHPWFIAGADPASPYHRFFFWRDSRPLEHGEAYAKRWTRHENGLWYYSAFGKTIPDLDVDNPVVKEKLFQTAKFWLEEMHVDGFRLDAIKHLYEDGPVNEHVEGTHRWLREFQTYCKTISPDCYIVGEVWSGTDAVARYTPDQVDACFQFELAGAFVAAAATEHVGFLAAKQSRAASLIEPPHMAPFLTNHDMMRVMEQLDRRPGRMKVAASLLLTAPGTPFMLYGEEVGIAGHASQGRSPMQWSSEPFAGFSTVEPHVHLESEWEKFNVAVMAPERDSILSHYREMIRLRQGSPALRRGRYVPLHVSPADTENYVLAPEGAPSVFGYAPREEGGVEFLFDPGRYTLPEGLSRDQIKSVSVAGDFNDWTPGKWPMEPAGDGTYRLERDHWSFSIDAHEFKYVINGDQWIEPPLDMPNRKHAGLAHESYNIVLRRSMDLAVQGCRVEGPEATLLFDPKAPATWINRATGAPVDPATVTVARVTAPGSFNDWDEAALVLTRGDKGAWSVQAPRGYQRGRRDEFRFLVNDTCWVTPSAEALNRTPARGGAPVYAFLRAAEDESVLAVHNLSSRPVSVYTISGGGPRDLPPNALATDLRTGVAVRGPNSSPDITIHEYRPLDELPAHSCTLIRFSAPTTAKEH